jgi:hypothetical protein
MTMCGIVRSDSEPGRQWKLVGGWHDTIQWADGVWPLWRRTRIMLTAIFMDQPEADTYCWGVMECQCALIETTYYNYCPLEGRTWWPSTAEIGMEHHKEYSNQGNQANEATKNERALIACAAQIVAEKAANHGNRANETKMAQEDSGTALVRRERHVAVYARSCSFCVQTTSFIEISIEAGKLLGGKHEACFVLGPS